MVRAGALESDSPGVQETNIGELFADASFDLETFALEAWGFVSRLSEMMKKQRGVAEEMSSKLVSSQETVISLQKEIIESKTVQLNEIQTTVETSVAATVQKGIKTYSEALGKSSTQSSTVLKKTVKEVVELEDRSRNVMIFGLPDSEAESVEQSVETLLAQLGEKPRVTDCRRIGRYQAEAVRPVQLTLSSASVAGQIRRKGKLLKDTVDFKTVYLSPDRTLAEREERKKLLANRKKEREQRDQLESEENVRQLRGRTINL